MMGEKDVVLYFAHVNSDEFEFGKGYMAQIAGKWVVKIHGLPELENVYYVAGFTTCFLSIGQLCVVFADEVCFLKKCCMVINKNGTRTIATRDSFSKGDKNGTRTIATTIKPIRTPLFLRPKVKPPSHILNNGNLILDAAKSFAYYALSL